MRDHTSLEAWREARAVVSACLFLSRQYWKPWSTALWGQVSRSALSVQLNIAEGYAFGPGGRWRHHLAIAYASAVETLDILRTLREEGLVPDGATSEAELRCQRCQRLLRGLSRKANSGE
jgi:four helix bundle protein